MTKTRKKGRKNLKPAEFIKFVEFLSPKSSKGVSKLGMLNWGCSSCTVIKIVDRNGQIESQSQIGHIGSQIFGLLTEVKLGLRFCSSSGMFEVATSIQC